MASVYTRTSYVIMDPWHGHWNTLRCTVFYSQLFDGISNSPKCEIMGAPAVCACLYCDYRCRQITEEMKDGHYTQDHYRVLGVDHKASHDAIREAYLKLAKKHHPDVSNGPQSGEHFKAIVSAWEASLEFPQSTPCHAATLLTERIEKRTPQSTYHS